MNRKKLEWNSELLDWAYWANLQSISAEDACWLVCGVDPILCNNESMGSKYYLSDEKKIEIKKAITQIESDIRAGKKKEYNSPWGWVCWAERKDIPVPKQFHALALEAEKKGIHVHKAQPLEEISEESLAWYMKQDSWAYYEAIFLIHGYKPPGSLEGFDEVRTHFPEMYVTLARSIPIGSIGKEVIQAGQKDFIDTPANWIAWAKRKGCNTDHLDSFINKQEINKPKTNNMPGNMPRIAIGQLAVKEAWEIERETGRRATAKEVLEKLQAWAENGQKYSEVLHRRSDGIRGMSVFWITVKSDPKEYSLSACEKTLERWHKSRQ